MSGTRCARTGPRSNQRGFALLLVFLMAGAVALMLYMQLPRVAFESERAKEELLIDRGEQYKRAIQLYFAEYKRFPSKIEDLESTNNKRYLRRRYVNPYTGKDEWRLVHTNGMFLTDSLVQKPPANPANSTGIDSQTQVAGATPTGNGTPGTPGDPNAAPAVNAAVLARPSDRQLTANSSFGGAGVPGGGVFPQPGDQGNSAFVDPASFPPISLFPNGYNAPAQQPGGQPAQARPGQPGFPGQTVQGGIQPGFNQPGFNQPGFNQPDFGQAGQFQQQQSGAISDPSGFAPNQGQSQPGQPFFPGQIPGQVPGQPFPGQAPGQQFPGQQFPGQFPGQVFPGQQAVGQPGQPAFPPGVQGVPGLNPNFANQLPQNPNPGFNQPGGGGAAGPPNQALNLINQLLTTPRQPPPGLGGTTAGNQTVGGGIAGVASTYTGPTIKSYAKRTKFEEWEFIFQLPQANVPAPNGANPANPGGATSPTGSPTGSGTPGPTTPGQLTPLGQPPAPGQFPNSTGPGIAPSGGLPPLP